MSQPVEFNGHLTRISTRSDGSLGITLESGAMVPENKLTLFNFQNIPCLVTLKPNDADAMPPKELKGELSRKTISERLRAVIFVWYKQLGSPGEFSVFYESEGNKVINSYKARLEPHTTSKPPF